MSGRYTHNRSMYECVDKDAESVPESAMEHFSTLSRPTVMAWLALLTILRKNCSVLFAPSEHNYN